MFAHAPSFPSFRAQALPRLSLFVLFPFFSEYYVASLVSHHPSFASPPPNRAFALCPRHGRGPKVPHTEEANVLLVSKESGVHLLAALQTGLLTSRSFGSSAPSPEKAQRVPGVLKARPGLQQRKEIGQGRVFSSFIFVFFLFLCFCFK